MQVALLGIKVYNYSFLVKIDSFLFIFGDFSRKNFSL